MTRRERLGRRLRELRESKGFGLRELARMTRLNPGTLCALERGTHGRALGRYATRLARVLGDEVLGLAAPGQLALRLDLRAARERPEFATPVRALLAEIAGEMTRTERIAPEQARVWTLPGAILIADRRLAAIPA